MGVLLFKLLFFDDAFGESTLAIMSAKCGKAFSSTPIFQDSIFMSTLQGFAGGWVCARDGCAGFASQR
jgi:hypothetical protein